MGPLLGPFWVQLESQIEQEDNDKSCDYNRLGLGDYSPEKAGVGLGDWTDQER